MQMPGRERITEGERAGQGIVQAVRPACLENPADERNAARHRSGAHRSKLALGERSEDAMFGDLVGTAISGLAIGGAQQIREPAAVTVERFRELGS